MSVSRKKKTKKYIDIVNTAQTRARARTTNNGVILVANTIAFATTHYIKIIGHKIKRGEGKGGKKLKVNGGKREKEEKICMYIWHDGNSYRYSNHPEPHSRTCPWKS